MNEQVNIDRYLPRIYSEAKRFTRRGIIDFEDLVNVGMMGVVLAEREYNSAVGASLLTFTFQRIRHEMQREMYSRTLIGRSRSSLATRVKKLIRENSHITNSEIADILEISEDNVEFLKGTNLSDSHATESKIEAGYGEGLEDYIDDKLKMDNLKLALQLIPENQRLVMEKRLAGATLEDVATDFQRSKERIRQIEIQAVAKLKFLVKLQAKVLHERVHGLKTIKPIKEDDTMADKSLNLKKGDRLVHATTGEEAIFKHTMRDGSGSARITILSNGWSSIIESQKLSDWRIKSNTGFKVCTTGRTKCKIEPQEKTGSPDKYDQTFRRELIKSALNGLLAAGNLNDRDQSGVAQMAIQYADQVLKELES